MGISPADVRALTLHEYLAILDIWNERHARDDDAPDAPDADRVARDLAALNQAWATKPN